MVELVFIALLQAVAGAPAAAEPVAPNAGATSGQQAGEPAANGAQTDGQAEPLRCRSKSVIGSRFARRICTTAAEDLLIADKSRRMLERIQSSRSTAPVN